MPSTSFPHALFITVIEQYTARSGMDSKMAKTCYHSHSIKVLRATTFRIKRYLLPTALLSISRMLFFSMNILNYTLVSSDYFPASSGSISFNSSENSNDNMIPPLLPPKKRICSPCSSSTTLPNPSRNQTCDLISPSSSVYTPTPPQIFEIGKCSTKMHLKHHEKQVEDILNYLDELSFHCIEKMEEGRINRMIIRRDGNKLKTELKRIRTQIIKLQKRKLGQKDKIAFAHYRISNLEQIIKEIQAPLEAQNCCMGKIPINPIGTPDQRNFLCVRGKTEVYLLTGTLTNDALSWWNSYAQPIGIDQANQISWTELKRLLTDKYCPRTEVKKMEDEFYNLTVKGNDLKTYVRRFQELTILCPNMVPNTEKLMEAFIVGLPRSIEGNVTASKPQTLEEAINIAQRLMDQIIKRNSMLETNDRKRKLEDERNIINNNNYQNNYNNNNRNNDYHRQQNRRQETFRTYTATNGYTGNLPLCKRWPQESILRDKLAFVHFRISTLETTLEDIQVSSESSSI
ncbi:reverse transcriptase domain-containing protein [Tanacetum coccineum]|uniref:Reverse transcriptase domain-containing protein n=1 Tax=Tanacetum coccineum TaxID=301880 RepID=A0ABQ5J5V4_9ASTR